jgi:hypothetical protein
MYIPGHGNNRKGSPWRLRRPVEEYKINNQGNKQKQDKAKGQSRQSGFHPFGHPFCPPSLFPVSGQISLLL